MRLKIALILVCIFLLSPTQLFAKKKITRRVKDETVTNETKPWDKLKLRSDKHAILLMLGGMKLADSLSYSLTYTADSVAQGIEGSHDPALGNTQKELVFGTCSGIDCTYHQNITDMFFEIKFNLTDGRLLTRKYQINLQGSSL
jgi:hypothetical protein